MQESNSSIDLNFCDTSFCAFLSTLRLVLILANISGWLRRGLTVWQVTNWSIWGARGGGVRRDLDLVAMTRQKTGQAPHRRIISKSAMNRR